VYLSVEFNATFHTLPSSNEDNGFQIQARSIKLSIYPTAEEESRL